MQLKTGMRNHNILLIIVVLLAAFLRLYGLGEIPVGVTHDELGYFYNAYSISQTGRNVFSEFLPFLTWMNPYGNPFMPIPTYLSVPFFWFLGLSSFVARLPSALLGILDILLIYILVVQIFKNEKFALLSALFLAISPWHLHFSRSSYDPNFALFFYLLAIVLFIYEIKRRIPVFSALALLFAVYSYRGMNIILPFLALLLSLYGYFSLRAKLPKIFFFSSGVILIVATLITTSFINGTRYTSEATQTFLNPKMQEEIDKQIRESQGPLVIRRLFLNKPAFIINKFRENYVRSYSPEFLFLYTEPNKIYSIWSRGRIYFIDLIFIVLGIVFLSKINKSRGLFITSLLLLGGLPGMIGGFPYSARNFFLSAIFPIITAGGILYLIQMVNRLWFRLMLVLTLIICYGYVFSGYLFDYYGRYSLYAAEPWFKSLKDIKILINAEKNNFDLAVVGNASFADSIQYAFYSKLSSKDVQNAWINRGHYKEIESYRYDNVIYTLACIPNKDLQRYFGNKNIYYITRENCDNESTPSAIIKDYFGNTLWKIWKVYKK